MITASPLNFEHWRSVLRADCEQKGKLTAFQAIGENALRLFWERGTEPSVEGILKDTNQNERGCAA